MFLLCGAIQLHLKTYEQVSNLACSSASALLQAPSGGKSYKLHIKALLSKRRDE